METIFPAEWEKLNVLYATPTSPDYTGAAKLSGRQVVCGPEAGISGSQPRK